VSGEATRTLPSPDHPNPNPVMDHDLDSDQDFIEMIGAGEDSLPDRRATDHSPKSSSSTITTITTTTTNLLLLLLFNSIYTNVLNLIPLYKMYRKELFHNILLQYFIPTPFFFFFDICICF